MCDKRLLLDERVEKEYLLSRPQSTNEDILVQYSCNTKHYRWAGKEKGFEPCNPPSIREEVTITFIERLSRIHEATHTFFKITEGDDEPSYSASRSPYTIRPDILQGFSQLPAEVYAVIKGVMDDEDSRIMALFEEDQQA